MRIDIIIDNVANFQYKRMARCSSLTKSVSNVVGSVLSGTRLPAVLLEDCTAIGHGNGSAHHMRYATASLSDFLQPTFEALFVDAAGTLLHPSESMVDVYTRYGRRFGLSLSSNEILERYRRAYATPWAKSPIRYVEDGRPFWRFIVKDTTGIDNKEMFEDVYEYYARGEAWTVAEGAEIALRNIRESGMKTAIVSNFDSRLHRILDDLGLTPMFDAIIVSADVSAEKPNPVIFMKACEELGVDPDHVIHVGDDRRNDIKGARDAGCFAWLWGDDVMSFNQIQKRIETGNLFDSLSDL